MIKNFYCVLGILLGSAACSSDVARLKATEYLRTQPGKPVTYPAGVDKPQQEKSYVIPELPKSAVKTESQPPELLEMPPRLSGVDVTPDEDEDEEDDEDKDEQETAGGEAGDTGFIETD
ncbi:MAG TPA: hypothetical protein VGL10_08760 [Gammaproteobacteria bacterium]